MKKMSLSFLLLILTQIVYSQFPYPYDLKRDTTEFYNSKYVLKTKIDSSGVVKDETLIINFNNEGFPISEFEINNSGDTIQIINYSYPDEFTEVEYHQIQNQKVDTGTFVFNKDGFLIQQIWNWGNNNEIDTSNYFYNNQNQIIKKADNYQTGYYFDTLTYQNNKLLTILSYDSNFNVLDSTSYQYAKDGKLEEIKSYNGKGRLHTLKMFTLNQDHSPTRIEENYKDGRYYNIEKKITTIEYFANGKKKQESIIYFRDGKLIIEDNIFYSKGGWMEKITRMNFKNNTKTLSLITIQKNSNTK